jgi:hypothetical protein
LTIVDSGLRIDKNKDRCTIHDNTKNSEVTEWEAERKDINGKSRHTRERNTGE